MSKILVFRENGKNSKTAARQLQEILTISKARPKQLAHATAWVSLDLLFHSIFATTYIKMANAI